MANAPYGWKTSIDLLRQEKPIATTLSGIKRSHYESTIVGTVLEEVTENAAPRQRAIKNAHHFVAENRIEASLIRKINTGDADQSTQAAQARRARLAPPGPSQNPLLSLSHPKYGLPETLVQNFAGLGVNSMYPWQSSCLLGRGLLEGVKNLVYTAPTGGGKSLVADVLMLKRVIGDASKKATLVLPYVALVQEKLKWLRRIVDNVSKSSPPAAESESSLPRWGRNHYDSIRVAGFFGGSKARAGWRDFDIAVCTMEKANGLVNTAITDGTINDLGVIVMDELHMIDDEHRGYLMELMASKIQSLESHVQLVGMSATLKNTELLAKWLNAKFYKTMYEAVPVKEYLVYDNAVYPVSTASALIKTASQLNSTDSPPLLQPLNMIDRSKHKELRSQLLNSVVALAIETALSGFGALVFCGGRESSQNMAALISEAMPCDQVSQEVLDRRREVVCELRSLPVGLDDVLGNTIIRGVAFHHAGLTTEERDIVAEAYDKGILRIIVATCSLAAGINLPARRVILHGARVGRELIGPAMLRQMRGRAGRKGKDEVGESYLCCERVDLEQVSELIRADLPTIESSLIPEKRGIQRALLEVITVQLATHAAAIQEYVRRTLLYHTMDRHRLDELVKSSLEELIETEMVKVDRYGGYQATPLSKATVASYLTPEDGLFLHDELRAALKAFVMDGEMHIFYTFTPVWNPGNVDINWGVFRKEIDALDESGLRVVEFVGVSPALVNRLANSPKPLPETNAEELRTARVYRRFYTALQLRDLCNEMPIHLVARKFQVPRGFVQTLAQICEGFAAGMVQFCEKMGWGMLKAALEHMSDRLKAGARADLLELAQIPFVKSRTARVFWENGFRDLRTVAEAETKDVLPVLLLAQPKKTRLDDEEQAKYHQKLLLKADVIIGAANKLWERQQHVEVETQI